MRKINPIYWSLRWKNITAIISLFIYSLIFILFYSNIGIGIFAFSVFPVIIIGSLFGFRFGILSNLVMLALNMTMLAWVDISAWEVTVLDGLPGMLVGLVIGAVVGRLSDLERKLSQALLDYKKTTVLLHEKEQAEIKQLQLDLEKERELNELKNRFMISASHEFRTPLAIIRASADIMKKYWDELSKEKRDAHFGKISAQIEFLAVMLNDIAFSTKIQVGQVKINLRHLDIDEFCKTLIENLQNTIGVEHHLVYAYQGSHNPIVADEKILQFILSNLLSNAIKYSSQSKRIDFVVQHNDDENIIFQIKDKGIGIPLEDKERLFDPYHRANNVGNIKGLGLGLAIVKDCVKLHGGEMKVESLLGKGSTFEVTLPIHEAEKAVLQKKRLQ